MDHCKVKGYLCPSKKPQNIENNVGDQVDTYIVQTSQKMSLLMINNLPYRVICT